MQMQTKMYQFNDCNIHETMLPPSGQMESCTSRQLFLKQNNIGNIFQYFSKKVLKLSK